MQRWVSKFISTITIFVVTMIFTFLPFKLNKVFLQKGELGKTIISCLNFFAGGVFFSTFILHMLPEVTRILDEALLTPKQITYPLVELIISLGFFLVLFIEKLAILLHYRKNITSKDMEVHVVMNGGGDAIQFEEISSEKKNDENPHEMRSVLLMVALSLHRIFEGLSIGLKNTVFSVFSLLIAVMCHETIIGFSLGMHLVKVKSEKKKLIISVILCCLMLPLGIIIGILITELDKINNTIQIVNGVLQSIATGTFIYITFFEILNEELEKKVKISGLLSLIIGFGVMALLIMIPENNSLVNKDNFGNYTI